MSTVINAILAIIIWLVIGFIINLLIYGNKPPNYLGKSTLAKTLHIISNIILAMALISIILK